MSYWQKKHRSLFLFLGLLLSMQTLQAQKNSPRTIAPLTLDDVTSGGRTWWEMRPEMPRVTAVLSEGILLYSPEAIILQGMNGEQHPFFTINEWQTLSETHATSLPYLSNTEHGGLLQISSGGKLYTLSPKDKKLIGRFDLSSLEVKDKRLSPKGDYLVLTDGKNLLLLASNATTPKAITKDGSLDIVYGMSAHREEFGIDRGIFFSPSGRYFAFYRIDQTEVEPYPLVQMEKQIARHTPIKYPMAGRASQKVTIGIYDTQTESIHYLETGVPEDRYFTNLTWGPDEKNLYIDEVTRDQTTCTLKAYDVQTGKHHSDLLKEYNEKYIEPQRGIEFSPANPSLFVRMSRIDGYTHLYLYDITRPTTPLRQLTKGEWEITTFHGIDPTGKWAYFSGNKEHPTASDLYRVSLKQPARIERITSGKGTHYVRLSNDFSTGYDSFSSLEVPGIATLFNLADKVERKEIRRCPIPKDLPMRPVVEMGSIKSADGKTDLYYKLTRPAKLEAGKKYPTIVYVYGGPHAQLVVDSWNGTRYNWDNYMAENGYVIFTVDNRGSAHRGMAFESVIHRQLGSAEMQDQMKGVDFLKSLPYVDHDRIGVYGWSFGGFMTTNLMLSHPETFKVAVAGGPVLDWGYYEVMYGERYMDTPAENPEGYEKTNLIKRAGELKGRLLLIHGSADPTVVWQHTQMFIKSAVKARTIPDYMVYPDHGHNVIGIDRVHLNMVICRYFDDFLKGTRP